MKKYAPLLFLLLLAVQGCHIGKSKPGTYNNEQIDKKLRAEISKLNKQVFNNICNNDIDALSPLFSDTLADAITATFSQKFIPQMARVMKSRTYKVFDEYYTIRAKARDTLLLKGGSGETAYTLSIFGMTNETYTSMLIAGDSLNEVMLTIVYARIKDKWKVNLIMGEDYSLNGKNAIALYHYAQQLRKDKYLVDAINIIGLARTCQTPGGKYFQYSINDSIQSLFQSIDSETMQQYSFPHMAKEVPTKPIVFNVHYEVYDRQLVPMVMYLSAINVSDTVALKQENDQFQQKIGAIFAGLDKNKKALLYRAYNNQPNGENDPRYYGFVQQLK